MSRPALLHNMSTPPRTVIRHKAAAPAGRILLFRLPPEISNTGLGGASHAVDRQELDRR
jgi:hypothetical protein